MPAGPCIVCGRTDYALSVGGPSICPRCDCGYPLADKVSDILRNSIHEPGVHQMAKTTKIVQLDGAELALRICEAITNRDRPPGLTARQALETLPKQHQQEMLRAAKAAADFIIEQIHKT